MYSPSCKPTHLGISCSNISLSLPPLLLLLVLLPVLKRKEKRSYNNVFSFSYKPTLGISRSSRTAESESLKVATETTNNSCFLAPARPLAPSLHPPRTETQLTCDSRAASRVLGRARARASSPADRNSASVNNRSVVRDQQLLVLLVSAFCSRRRTANRHQWYFPGEKVNGSTIKEREKAFGKLWLTAQSQRKVDPIGFLFAFGWRMHGPITV